MKLGIIGLPQSGKTTIFNALTRGDTPTTASAGRIEVHTAVVDRGAVEETVTNTRAGTVKVRRRANLSPQVGGLVVRIPHLEGDEVAEGDVLLVMDDRAQRAEFDLASPL